MDRLDAGIYSAQGGESNRLRRKLESSRYISLVLGLQRASSFFSLGVNQKIGDLRARRKMDIYKNPSYDKGTFMFVYTPVLAVSLERMII